MSYYPARSLMNGSSITAATTGLVGEINKKYPNRDHASDGWVGDTSHAARPSDHNPDYSEGGIVRAVDIDNNGGPNELTPVAKDVLNAAIGDPRVYYVIYARKIYSRTYGWVARAYTGSNPHDKHIHVSVIDGPGENDDHTWLEQPPRKIKAKKVSLENVRKAFQAAAAGKKVEFNNGVGRIQRVLNAHHDADLDVDGYAGKATLQAWARYEREAGIDSKGRDYIPDEQTLRKFAKGHFRTVA